MRDRPLRPILLMASLAVLAACSGGPTSQAGPAASPSATGTPAATGTPTPAAGGGPTASPPAPAGSGGGGSTPAGFQACPQGGVTSGEPPAQDNGPKGACEAARILLPPTGPPCRPPGGTYAGGGCPLYPALAQRLDQHPLSSGGGGADPICRCQNTWQSASYAVRSPLPNDPTGSDVRVTLDFGAGGSRLSLDVIVEGVQSGSLVSDIQCGGGGAGTSILQQPSAANRYLACT